MESQQVDRAIARIHGSTEKTKNIAIGAGFWVFPGYLLTCAHVVNQALGIDATSQVQPKGTLSLDFPFSGDDRRFEGRVKFWRSVERSEIGRDIAVLTVAGSVPDDVVPIALVEATGLPLICKGFPEGYDAFTLSAEMTVMEVASNGYVQLENPQGRVAPGFSGGPVWEKGGTGVVGMIVEADVGRQVAFMISAGVLRSVLQQLKYAPIQLVLEESRLVLKDVISRAYQYAIPVGWSKSKAPEEINELLKVIDSIPLDGQEPAIAKFLGYLCADSISSTVNLNTGKTLTQFLVDWSAYQFNNFSEIIRNARREYGKRVIQTESATSKDLSSHLLILLQSDGSLYSPTAWLVVHYDRNSNTNPPSDMIHKLNLSNHIDSIKTNKIASLVESCIEEAVSRSLSLHNLKIEFFLPLDLTHEPFESLKLSDGRSSLTMGLEYKVVLRDSGRCEPGYRKHGEWKSMWNYLQDNQEYRAYDTLISEVEDSDMMSSLLNDQGVLGLKMSSSPPKYRRNSKNHILAVFSRTGCPIAIWLRKELENVVGEALNDFLLDSYAWSLPDDVKKLRNKAIRCGNSNPHIGSHVVLLWENPYLLPPVGRDFSNERL